MDKIVLDGELSLNIPLDGEVGLMSLIEVGIAEIRFNSDYTITFVMTDGRTYTSEPVRGADGEKGDKGDKGDAGDDYILTQADKEEIAGMVDIPVGNNSQLGVVKGNISYGINVVNGEIRISSAASNLVKVGSTASKPITPNTQHESAFYGLAKVAGHDEKDSTLPVGTYTEEAKTAIRTMLGLQDVYDDYSSALEALGVIE